MGDEQEPKAPKDPSPESGPEQQPGVPPETTGDVEGDQVDQEGAQSFPASDPPGHY